jgi:hypothetical protein
VIRSLVIIAVVGFVVSIATLSAAVGIAGPEAVMHGAWTWGPNGWGRDGDSQDAESSDPRVQTTRRIAWSGGDTLTVEIPADVEITRASGPPQIAISGPVVAVADVEIEDGVIRFRTDDGHDGRVTLSVAAPQVTRIEMKRHGAVTLPPAQPVQGGGSPLPAAALSGVRSGASGSPKM